VKKYLKSKIPLRLLELWQDFQKHSERLNTWGYIIITGIGYLYSDQTFWGVIVESQMPPLASKMHSGKQRGF
jgi:hypothetical protein